MTLRTLAVFTTIYCSIQSGQGTSPKDSDVNLNLTQLAAKYGHPAEEYVVYTQDGYRLKVFRLPNAGKRLPVLLFHGVLDSSDTWIIRGNGSLAITLANAGYDVWLGNVRGNKHSQGHHSSNLASNSTYWNFTFHEVGVYDLPTTIDLVLNKTRAPKVNTIGHSQGTTIHYVLLSCKPEYNNKVNMVISLAPVAYLSNSPEPLSTLFKYGIPVLYKGLTFKHKYSVFDDDSPEIRFIKISCHTPHTAYKLCIKDIVFKFAGSDPSEVGQNFSLVIVNHYPSATSTKTGLHYAQLSKSKKFARFDYGKKGNLIAYNSETPPRYDLKKIKSKMVLLTATNDNLSRQPDAIHLARQLPNVVRYVVNPYSKMNHLDYVWGKNMATYLFPYIFDSLKRFGKV